MSKPAGNVRPETNRLHALGIERRRSRRECVLTPGMLRQLDVEDAEIIQVMVTDVSMHGVGFRSEQPIDCHPDTYYFIEIGVGPLHLTSRLRIARARQLPKGAYDIGGEFC